MSASRVAPAARPVPVARGAAQRRVRSRLSHALVVRTLQVPVVLVVLGGWEGAARAGLIESFFFSMPSAIGDQLVTWVQDGTSIGPLWLQVLVTLEETVVGFLIGVAGGVV